MPGHLLKQTHALPFTGHPWLLGLVDVGTGFWLVLYVLAIIEGFRMRTYVVPLVAIAANFSWELIAAVYRVAPVPLWHIGDILWLALDAGVVATLLLYGRNQQLIPEVRRGFYGLVALSFVIALVTQLALEQALADEWGFLDAYLISVMMSILFFFMYFARRTAGEFGYAIAWCKFLGNGLTSAGFIFLFPLLGGAPMSRFLLYWLAATNCVVDAAYVALLTCSRRAVRDALPTASSSRSASVT